MSSLLRTILATSIAQALPIASGHNNLHGILAAERQRRRGDRIAPDVPETFTTLEIRAKPQAGDCIELPEVGPKRERSTVGVLATTRHARQAFMKRVLELKDGADTPLLDSKNPASGDIPAVLTVLARPEGDFVPLDGEFVQGTTTAWKSGNKKDGKKTMRTVADHDDQRADPSNARKQSVYCAMHEVKLREPRTNYRKYCAKETHLPEKPHRREHDTNFVLFPAMKPEGEYGVSAQQRFGLRHGHSGVLAAAKEAQKNLVESGLLSLSAREEYPLFVILSGEAQHQVAELKLVGQLLADDSKTWSRLAFVVHRDEGICNPRMVLRRAAQKACKLCSKKNTVALVQERIDAAKVNAAVYKGYNDPDLMNLVWGA